MQVGMNVSCMHTNFDGCGFSGFRDIATFKNGQVSLSDHGLTVHCCQKINQSELAQNIHANRGRCEMHGNQLGWGGLSDFGDLFAFINGQISLRTMDYKSMGSKIKLAQKNSCK